MACARQIKVFLVCSQTIWPTRYPARLHLNEPRAIIGLEKGYWDAGVFLCPCVYTLLTTGLHSPPLFLRVTPG